MEQVNTIAPHVKPSGRAPERTCIVTRQAAHPSALIRFVMGPDGTVVPDLKRNLPGRGVWVTATRATVEKAVSGKLFARGFKVQVQAAHDLPDLVDALLLKSALGALGFARKAGDCTFGSSKVENLVRSGKAIGLLHASDGADDGLRKLTQAVYAAGESGFRTPSIWRLFTIEQMSLALGATHVIHAALTGGSAGTNCRNTVVRLATYRGAQPHGSKNSGSNPLQSSDQSPH